MKPLKIKSVGNFTSEGFIVIFDEKVKTKGSKGMSTYEHWISWEFALSKIFERPKKEVV